MVSTTENDGETENAAVLETSSKSIEKKSKKRKSSKSSKSLEKKKSKSKDESTKSKSSKSSKSLKKESQSKDESKKPKSSKKKKSKSKLESEEYADPTEEAETVADKAVTFDEEKPKKKKKKKKKRKSSIDHAGQISDEWEATPSDAEKGSKSDPVEAGKKESFMQAASSKALRPFVIISSSYLLFTITDGAIRMIVLLHAYNKQFSALEVAIMFTLYELAGVFTNLVAGLLGAKWGIKLTLICGLTLQIFSYGLLFGWREDWSKRNAIIYVTFAQMFAGIAKDLTKLGGKTVTKLVTPDEQETKLFKLVSLITGWKNSLKGVGYFLGSALISKSYALALWFNIGLVLLAMPWAILGLDKNLGTAKKKNASLSEIFVLDNINLNWLSLARLFLFASRDFWFEVPLPFFLRSPSCEGLGITECLDADDCTRGAICGIDGFCANLNEGGGCGGLGLPRTVVGAFLGGYIILYGQVQSWTPQLVTGPLDQTPPNKLTEMLWGLINCLPTFIMWAVMTFGSSFENSDFADMVTWLVCVIVAFAIIFAINSSVHSYLVVKYASKDKIAVSVGLYYMSNAVGRLFGTLGSGLLYTYVGEGFGEDIGSNALSGTAACFLAGTLSSLLAALITYKIDDQKEGLKCGPCLTIAKPVEDSAANDAEDGTTE